MRTLLAFGDSNTHGTLPMADLLDVRRLAPGERWPGVAAAALAPDWRVVEEGLPGRTTVHPDPIGGAHKSGIAILPALLESHAPLDLVTIMLGTNDLKARFGVPPVEVAAAIERLALLVRSSVAGPGGRPPALLLVAPPAVEEAGCLAEIFAGGAAKSRRLAPLVEALAARLGAGFLDAGAVIAPSRLDGVHFDAEAHRALGGAIASAIRHLAP